MANVQRQTVSRPTPVKRPTPIKAPATKPVVTTKAASAVIPSKENMNPKGYMGKRPLAMIVYGPPKVGKTEFAAYFPDPGFIYDPQEPGILDLLDFNRCPKPVFTQEVDTFSKLIEFNEKIATGKTGIRTAVYDALTGLQHLCFMEHCETYFGGDWSSEGFYAFGKGPVNAAEKDWSRLIESWDAIREEGINIVLIAHSNIKVFENPFGPNYDRFKPVANNEIWQRTHKWAQTILFYNFHVEVGEKKAGGQKGKASETEQRNLYADWSPLFDAGNRSGLEPVIDAGSSGKEAYTNFANAFKKAISSKRAV